MSESTSTEPRECPTPGACSALVEIERLRNWINVAISDFERGYPGQAYVSLLNAQEGLS